MGSLATELGKAGDALHAPAAGLLLGLETHLCSQFARVLPEADAAACAEHLLVLLQGAAVLAQARREPSIVRRQVEGAAAWLDAVLAAAPQRTARAQATRPARR